MSIYEVHLGSLAASSPKMGTVPLTYQELAVQLARYVQDLGFTHVELLPVAEHPFGGSWGYQVANYYAPTARFGHPGRLSLPGRPPPPGGHRRARWTGCPATSRATSGRWAASTAPRSTSTPTRARASSPTGARYVFNFGRNEVRNFLVANAHFWLEEYHVDGLRVDAVASMLYLDYSRRPASGCPTSWGGRENEEAIAFLRELNTSVQHSPSRRARRSPRSPPPGRR